MTPEQLSDAVVTAVRGLHDDGALSLPGGPPETVTIERPRQLGHGDYATNVALQLAKQAGLAPRELAELVAERLRGAEGMAAVEVAGPGFLNITVDAGAQGQVAADIVAAGPAYGGSEAGQKQKVNVEFVSANPTGPVTLASARWAAVGDTLSRLLEATGHIVTREYYFNDHGAQIDRFSRSLLAARATSRPPRTAIRGSTSPTSPTRSSPPAPTRRDSPTTRRWRRSAVSASASCSTRSSRPCATSGCRSTCGSTRTTSTSPAPPTGRLRGCASSATSTTRTARCWLRTEKFGDDKDRVIVKSDGHGAYISGDAAYYLDKRERGFDRCLILLGADHHGYVGRMMALCAAFGDEPGVNLEIIIGQMVNLLSHGSVVRMGKRTGNIITLLDLVEAVGIDAARYALVRNSLETNLDIDLDLWTKATNDNPVFYVQYAHARVSSILRNAADLGLEPSSASRAARATRRRASCCARSPSSRGSSTRRRRCASRTAWPATSRTPPRPTTASTTPAGCCRWATRSRPTCTAPGWCLVDATRVVLANGLALLGVSAPERM